MYHCGSGGLKTIASKKLLKENNCHIKSDSEVIVITRKLLISQLKKQIK